MTVEPRKAVHAAGADHVPESRQNVSCYYQGTINKNEGNFDDDHDGVC